MRQTVERFPTDTDVDLNEHLIVASTMIDCFLAGITNGQIVFEALFGDVLDEPVPERLLRLIGSYAARPDRAGGVVDNAERCAGIVERAAGGHTAFR